MRSEALPGSSSRVVRFGPFAADFGVGELRRNGRRVRLQDQPLRVLALLTDRPGQLVTRDELRALLWPADTFVDFEHGLNTAVKRLRDALGDSAARPRYVETLPRRGYRWVALLDSQTDRDGVARSTTVDPTPMRSLDSDSGAASARSPTAPGRLEDAGRDDLSPTHAAPVRRRWPVASAVLVVLASCGVLAVMWTPSGKPASREPPSPKLLEVVLPEGQLLNELGCPFAVSHDGTKLVYAIGSFQGSQLVVRSLDDLGTTTILGTLSARDPFFSPDDQWVAFGSDDDNTLKKVPVTGGPVVTLAGTHGALAGGGDWGPRGVYFSAGGFTGEGLSRVSPNGGAPEPVTTLDPRRGEMAHLFPQVLPGSRALLFTVVRAGDPLISDVVVQSLATGERQAVVPGADRARYLSTGHLVYALGDRLLVAPFDPVRLSLSGQPVPIADGLSRGANGTARFAVTDEGTLVYAPATRLDQRSLVWVDRNGREKPLAVPPNAYGFPVVSPDGRRVAVNVRAGPDPAQGDLWLHDLGSTRLSRLTSAGTATNAVWSRDGSAVTFAMRSSRTISMVSQPVDGDGQSHTLFSEDAGLWPGSWTPDGRALAYMIFRPGRTGGDISIYEPGGAVESRHYLDSTSTEWGARLSPNGRLMAYVSNESGRWEVYLRPFPGPGGHVQISTGGGTEVVWARSGREVFFRNGRGLFAVRVGPGPALEVNEPALIFEGRYGAALPGVASYDVSPDGSRFLMVKPGVEEAEPRRLRFVLNWARGS